MPTLDWKKLLVLAANAEEFDVATGDFSVLSIRAADDKPGFHYFYHEGDRRLIKRFVLREGPRVDTLCDVALIAKDDALTPRIRLWKRDKTAPKQGDPTKEQLIAGSDTVLAKASIALDDCHDNFWKLISYLTSCKEVTLPTHEFRVAPAADVALATALEGHDKTVVLEAVKATLGGSLTDRDVQMLIDRKRAVGEFERLLTDSAFFDSRVDAGGPTYRAEDVWQDFFEEHPWIFGYGLTLIFCDRLDAKKLQQPTTGADALSGAGKRVDAIMKTRGFIHSLLFAEIKHHRTDLLVTTPYRPPDVYRVSKELSGAVSQLQKTAHKAVKPHLDLHRQHSADGTFLLELSTIKPRQVVVIGNLEQLTDNGQTNVEKLSSFELFRRNQQEVEIITFDELFARARFIALSETRDP